MFKLQVYINVGLIFSESSAIWVGSMIEQNDPGKTATRCGPEVRWFTKARGMFCFPWVV